MKTMNGFTNELLVKKAKRNWRTRCGAFLLAVLASWCGSDVLGDVVITTGAGNGLAPGYLFTTTPTPPNPAGWNAGGAYDGGAAYSWNGNLFNDLNYLANGMTVQTVNGEGTGGTHNLSTTDNLTFTGTGGGEVHFSSSLNWGGNSNFVVDTGATGTVWVRNNGAVLNLGNRLIVNALGTLVINKHGVVSGNYTTGGITLSGGTNSGTIDVENSNLWLTGNVGGGGTILVGSGGMLYINTSNEITQNINGSFTPNSDARGAISIGSTDAKISGTLSNNIAFTGGGVVTIKSNNSTTLNRLYALDGTCVVLEDNTNIGNVVVSLGNYGGIAKASNVGSLTIDNNIVLGTPAPGGTSSVGSISSFTTLARDWEADADSKYDGGSRFTLTGTISQVYVGGRIYINDQSGASGTVVLTGSNSAFNGSYYIDKGVLEINSQQNLGTTSPSGQSTVFIGDATEASARSALRVAGTKNTTTTITHWINLVTSNAFYEVYTDGESISNMRTLPDSQRFTVIQTGQISGDGNLNKSGDGVLQLAVLNSYTGDTNIYHGVLRINDQDQINNSSSATIRIGDLSHDNNPGLTTTFRPVFETHLNGNSAGTININAFVEINQTNSTIRTTGLGNETILNNSVTTSSVIAAAKDSVLNKDGAGTLTLNGQGYWGISGAGKLAIKQGTVQFFKSNALGSGTITIGTDWNTYKDIELVDDSGNAITYKAILKLGDNSIAGIGNQIDLASPAPGSTDPADAGSYIEVGTESILTVSGAITESIAGANLNKIGTGELVLKGTKNTFTGWTRILEGTVSTTVADNMSSSAGVNLVGDNTKFDMSATGADQTLKGLVGTDTTNPTDPEQWTRIVDIGNNTLTLNQQQLSNVLHGFIIGDGTFVKSGVSNSVFEAGFYKDEDNKFTGKFDVQVGTLKTSTDAYLTGIAGKAGTYLDIQGNSLTIDIDAANTYSGTIMSSYKQPIHNVDPADCPTDCVGLIKDGVGTLTAGFYERNVADNSVKAYMGNLTMKRGNIISTTDYHMEGGSHLTFYVNSTGSGDIETQVLEVGKNGSKQAVFREGGTSGKDRSTVHVFMADAMTGWNAANGEMTVGKILGNDKSDYSGLDVAGTDSLFYSLNLNHEYTTGRHDLLVNVDITGFAGVGDSYNTRQVGENLDRLRVTNLSGHGLAPLLQDLWAGGSNIGTSSTHEERAELINDVFRQLSADTIANAIFMGLDRPWHTAFDRLNLDSQMVYVTPQQPQGTQYRGQQRIANMRNIWFTPTVQSVSARSDGNARKYGIDRAGYKLGFDKRVAQNASVGFMLGYSDPKLHQNDDRVTGSDFQFGVYGGAMIGYYVEVKGFIGFGHQNYKSHRTVFFPTDKIIDDGAGGYRSIGGNTNSMSAHGRYDGDTFNFSLEVSRPLFLGFSILRPTIGLDSEHAFRYGFTETGDAIAMKFDRASVSRTRMRFGLSLETCTLDRAIFSGRLGYSALLGGRDYATSKGQFVGVASTAPQEARSVAVGKSYFEAGVGTRIFLNPYKTLALVGNYDASIANRWAEHQGLVGFTYIY